MGTDRPQPLVRRIRLSSFATAAVRCAVWSLPVAVTLAALFLAGTRERTVVPKTPDAKAHTNAEAPQGPDPARESKVRPGATSSVPKPSLGRPGLFAHLESPTSVRNPPSIRALASAQREKLTLVGIRGGEEPIAIITDTTTGKTAEARVGETVHGVEVTGIDSRSVTLSYQGERFELQL